MPFVPIAPGSAERRLSTTRAATEMLYPMHAMRVDTFLERYASGERKLESHQKLKKLGLVMEVASTDMTEAEVLFISHEWAGFTHADPNGDQTRELCTLLQRLRSGAVGSVESAWEYQLLFKRKDTVTASEWVKRLEKAYIWLDYVCVPQPNATDDDESTTQQPQPVTIKRQSTADARVSGLTFEGGNDDAEAKKRAELLDLCGKAVSSIPGYIELSTIFVVFAPNTPHAERTEEQGATTCTIASWRARGWCRTEFIGGLLAPRPKCYMFVNSGSTTPTFVFPGDAVSRLLPGLGDFTCCALGHRVCGKEIACDKPKIRDVLSSLIDGKLERLLKSGKLLEYRYLIVTRPHFLQALPDPNVCVEVTTDATAEPSTEKSMGELDTIAVEELKLRLKWTDEDEKAGARTGWNLLKYASVAGEGSAVRALLRSTASLSKRQKHQLIDAPLSKEGSKPLVHMCVPTRATTLILTAWVGNVQRREEILSMLLDAGANPHATEDINGGSAFCNAAGFGCLESVKFFLERYPSCAPLERPSGRTSLTPLMYAAFLAATPKQGPIVRMLLEHGANVKYIAATGRTVLLCSALNDQCDHTVLKELIDLTKAAGMSIDLPCVARSLKWKLIFFVMTRKYAGQVSWTA